MVVIEEIALSKKKDAQAKIAEHYSPGISLHIAEAGLWILIEAGLLSDKQNNQKATAVKGSIYLVTQGGHPCCSVS